MIDKLKDIFGPKCTAININGEITEFINVPSKKMKFCEAVSYSFHLPLRLNEENLGCPGARRSVAYENNDLHLASTIAGNNNIPVKFIRDALGKIPKLQDIQHINLGLTTFMENDTKPDLFIAYVLPDAITAIMHNLAQKAIQPSVPPYCLLSVCGNVFANCLINQKVSISFGCPESRKHGGVENNEIILGIPYKIALKLVKDFDIKFT